MRLSTDAAEAVAEKRRKEEEGEGELKTEKNCMAVTRALYDSRVLVLPTPRTLVPKLRAWKFKLREETRRRRRRRSRAMRRRAAR